MDLVFTALTVPICVAVLGASGADARSLALAWIITAHLLATVAMQLGLWWLLRPIARWRRVRDTAGATDEIVTTAAQSVYAMPRRAALFTAIVWTSPPVTLVLAFWVGHPYGVTLGARSLAASALLCMALFFGALTVILTLVPSLLAETAAGLSLALQHRRTAAVIPAFSLAKRVLLIILAVGLVPLITWAAYMLAPRGPTWPAAGDFLLLLFMLAVVLWVPMAATTVAGAIARPLGRVASVISAISHQEDASRIAPLPIYFMDEVGQLAQGVNRMIERLARSATHERELDALELQFVRAAAHELKTPVTVMRGYAEILLASAHHLPEERRKMPEAIVRGADRIAHIVDDLLELSELHMSRMEVERAPVDLRVLACEEVGRRTADAPRHRLRVSGESTLVVAAESRRVSRVIRMLLDNAIRYSPDGGEVQIVLQRGDEEAVVSVEDHGVGIPPEKQPRIFQAFYRAHSDTPHDFGGLGISLFQCRRVVSRHGGRMWFHSEEGRGSTFSFSLPLTETGDP